MSKERARRRAERERVAALKAAAHQREQQRRARAQARRQALTRWIPRAHPTPGVLAARRRAELRATVALLLVLNVLVWIATPAWSARVGAIVVSLVVFPVVRLMMTRR